MNSNERLKKFEDDDFDKIILLIRNGTIKSGRYSNLVKIRDGKIIKDKELFSNGN